MNIAIITARGGSKRIPRKNIKDFCGKPIIAYSIEAALSSGCFDEVMVSTDDEEIAEISRRYGAKVPFMRSETTSNDYATTADVLLEVLSEYKKLGKEFDIMACLYPTAPFVTGNKLKEAFDIIDKTGADGVVPVVRFSFPPQRGFIVNNGRVAYKYPEYKAARSQDLEPFFHDCGQFYISKVSAFFKNKWLITDNTCPLIVAETEVQDIDNETDWQLAEIKYKFMVDNGSDKSF